MYNVKFVYSKTSYSNRIIDPIPEEEEMDTVRHNEQASTIEGMREVTVVMPIHK